MSDATPRTSFIDIQALVGMEEGDLIKAGLQALHRERAQAYRTHLSIAQKRKDPLLPPQSFGLEETTSLLNRMGVTPEDH